MSLAQQSEHRQRGMPPDGLHRFEPSRDLPQVVELLRLGFGDDLDDQERRWLSDLEAMADSGPFLTLLRFVPSIDSSFSGFVWYVDGRLVANASLMRAPSNVAVIANVVTHPDYRRQGIARQLTEASIAAARDKLLRRVELQVRQTNEAATSLYYDLGFRRMHGNTTLRLGSPSASVRLARAAGGFEIVKWGRSEDRLARRFVQRVGRSHPEPVRGPVAEALKSYSLLEAIENWLLGRNRLCWAATQAEDFKAVAAVSTRTGGGSHRYEIVTDPAWRGKVEAALVDAAMVALCRRSDAPVEAKIRDDETGAREALEAAGFVYVRTLDRLVLPLDLR
jgi:ribosomal protein S18 acetylase RimI-like enzyme